MKLRVKNIVCPLCGDASENFFENKFFRCTNCRGISKAEELRLSGGEEKARYELHNNDVNDERYKNFVMPVVSRIRSEFSAAHKGLDFGAGKGSAVSFMLKQSNYNIEMYDPYFYNSPELLERKYDYIAACEVIEHFYFPGKEFRKLEAMLSRGGILFCMTHIFEEGTDFGKWYYKNDPTHVFIYSKDTIEWISKEYGFELPIIDGRLIRLKKSGP
jgi:hypothetical protein